ncbi:tetratricopeptide repeat protein [Streptomyces catenulae]|uniref:Tetratricopeptide repeat protein n=1 Tax=Streptomyces catenulae TaxID=66875 RepID=A0ABV2YYD5_9ACTN|nr:tetratricopeptide repeat protein [Streptomyces catenulae]
MLDPTSMAAVSSLLSTMAMSMATEAGKRGWESLGALARRIAGREVPAPVGPEERGELAAVLAGAAARDPEYAHALGVLFRTAPAPAGATAVPRQLPATARFFTDRRRPLKQLDKEAGRKADGLPRVAVVYGPGGIGTSAVPIHWGSRNLHRYPDGQLYLDLRGGADGAADAPAVLRHFLRKLGVADADVPPAAEDRIDLYRTLVADRRLLVVLDHARSAAQVAPLLTGAPGVFTIVVARRPPTGLDAVPVPVGPLAAKDARALLGRLTGVRGRGDDGAALQAVLDRCGGFPYALRTAATSLALPRDPAPDGPVPPAPEPAAPDPDPVRAAAADAYRALPADAARLHRLLALHPWPAIGPAQAAATAEIGRPEAERLLGELVARGLLETRDGVRYHHRPLVRQHAEALAAREDRPAGCSAAVSRTVGWALRLAVPADRAALPERWHLGPLYDLLPPGPYADPRAALATLDCELPTLVAAVLAAEAYGDHHSVWQLCEALWAVQLKAGRHEQVLPALRAGVRAARALAPGSDPVPGASGAQTRVRARMHTQLALALTELGADHFAEAEEELRQAARVSQLAGHRLGQATAVETLGLLRLRQWRYAEALDLFEEADAVLVTVEDGGEGSRDVPRARALLRRHRGRALRGLGRCDEATRWLEEALTYFRAHDPYNTARALTDLAETRSEAGRPREALAHFEEAAGLLAEGGAGFQLMRLRELREAVARDTE